MGSIYDTLLWQTVRARALARDGNRCTVSQLLGGHCAAGPLHAHHIIPVSEGGEPFDLHNVGTTCSAHHPMWEALRRTLVKRMLRASEPARCTHEHRSREARLICERRKARQRQVAA